MPRVGVRFCVSARARARARPRMCVMRVVMNKDVLCVELVVNHWQRWQLTDRQIDPRPPRERCLALAHSSHTHAHARAHTVHIASTKIVRRLAKGFELQIISDHLMLTSVRVTSRRGRKRGEEMRDSGGLDGPDNICGRSRRRSPVNPNLAFVTVSNRAHE